MARFGSSMSLRQLMEVGRCRKPIFQLSRNRSFIKRKAVSRDECLKMSRTSGTDFQSILRRMNLFGQFPHVQGSSANIQILKSNFLAREHLCIRPGKSFATYHRIELVMQRLAFMSEIGFSSKEKICAVKKNPPLLILVKKQFGDSSQMVYLRGLLKEGSNVRYLFYPIFPRTRAKKAVLDDRLDEISSSMNVTRQQVLNIAMGLPCISISKNSLDKYKENIILLHLKTLPKSFNLDLHSLDIYPPICGQSIEHFKKTSPRAQHEDFNLEGADFPDLLDTSYSTSNGPLCPEDLSEFLLRSHSEECQYLPPVNFKQKKIPRKQRRYSNLSAFEDLLSS